MSDQVGNQNVGFLMMRLNFFVVIFCFCEVKIVCINVAICDSMHDKEPIHGQCKLQTAAGKKVESHTKKTQSAT